MAFQLGVCEHHTPALAEVMCACEISVIKAGTPPENLEGSFTCQSLCFFSLITSIMFWTDGFENITQRQETAFDSQLCHECFGLPLARQFCACMYIWGFCLLGYKLSLG